MSRKKAFALYILVFLVVINLMELLYSNIITGTGYIFSFGKCILAPIGLAVASWIILFRKGGKFIGQI